MRAEHKVVNVLAKQLLVGRMLFAVSFLFDRHCLLDDREGAAGSNMNPVQSSGSSGG